MKVPTLESLVKRRLVVIADASSKLEAEDWHGVADACMDLREIDAMLLVSSEQAFHSDQERHAVHAGEQ